MISSFLAIALGSYLLLPGLTGELQKLLEQEKETAGRMHIGLMVKNLDSGTVPISFDAAKLFVPASNQKLLTSAAALDVLGPEHRFTTTAGPAGEVVGGMLAGDLVLVGGGDPSLTAEELRALAAKVPEELGIRELRGDVVVDVSLFDGPPKGPGWAWDDDPDTYNMSVSPLMLNYNVLTVVVQPAAQAGRLAQVRYDLPAAWPPLLHEVQTVPAETEGTYVRATRTPFVPDVGVRGTIAAGADPVRRSLNTDDPARWAGEVFLKMLEQEGVAIRAGARAVVVWDDPPTLRATATMSSEPLAKILADFNKPSENAIGEVLLHHLAIQAGADQVTFSTGADALSTWLEEVAGVPAGGFSARDGSGLSRYNMIAPDAVVALLEFMWDHQHRDVYLQSLPIAGVDGTLRSRMEGTAAQGIVYAKTGTMTGVSCLSGYVLADGKEPAAFSLLTNGFVGSSGPSRALQDQIVVLLAGGDPLATPAGQ